MDNYLKRKSICKNYSNTMKNLFINFEILETRKLTETEKIINYPIINYPLNNYQLSIA